MHANSAKIVPLFIAALMASASLQASEIELPGGSPWQCTIQYAGGLETPIVVLAPSHEFALIAARNRAGKSGVVLGCHLK